MNSFQQITVKSSPYALFKPFFIYLRLLLVFVCQVYCVLLLFAPFNDSPFPYLSSLVLLSNLVKKKNVESDNYIGA